MQPGNARNHFPCLSFSPPPSRAVQVLSTGHETTSNRPLTTAHSHEDSAFLTKCHRQLFYGLYLGLRVPSPPALSSERAPIPAPSPSPAGTMHPESCQSSGFRRPRRADVRCYPAVAGVDAEKRWAMTAAVLGSHLDVEITNLVCTIVHRVVSSRETPPPRTTMIILIHLLLSNIGGQAPRTPGPSPPRSKPPDPIPVGEHVINSRARPSRADCKRGFPCYPGFGLLPGRRTPLIYQKYYGMRRHLGSYEA